jgi:hypothetical protein
MLCIYVYCTYFLLSRLVFWHIFRKFVQKSNEPCEKKLKKHAFVHKFAAPSVVPHFVVGMEGVQGYSICYTVGRKLSGNAADNRAVTHGIDGEHAA